MTPPRAGGPKALPRAMASLGLALLAPLLVVAATGLLLSLRYVPDPLGVGLRLAELEQDRFWSTVRNLHLWSARFTLALAIAHAVRATVARAWAPARREAFELGVALLVVLVLQHLSGHVLRWDGQGRAVALGFLHAMRPLGGAQTWLGLDEPATADADLLHATFLFHSYALGLALAALTWVHLARLRRLPPADDSHQAFAAARWRAAAPLMAVMLGFLVVASAASPAPLATTDEQAPWPFALWGGLADAAGTVWAPLGLLLLVLALLAWLPYAKPALMEPAIRAGLGLVAVATLLPWP